MTYPELNFPFLKFSSFKAFYNYVNSPIKDNNFYSLAKYYRQLEYMSDSLGVEAVKHLLTKTNLVVINEGKLELNNIDLFTASFISPEGIYQVGDTIIKIYPERIIFVLNGDISLLMKAEKSSNITSKYINIYETKQNKQTAQRQIYRTIKGEKYRLDISKWYRNYVFYATVGANVKTYLWQRKWNWKKLKWEKNYYITQDDYDISLSWDKIEYAFHETPIVTIPSDQISRQRKKSKGITISYKVVWNIGLPPQPIDYYKVYGLKLTGESVIFGKFSL